MTQALPPDEEQRVRVVHELGMPRGSGTAPLAAVMRLLQQQTGWPMGGISLIDDKQQWFVTAFGVEATSTDRWRSLCGNVISARAAADGSFVVTDTRLDPRWAWAERASDELSVRAYAGVALKVNDQAVGTLCVFHSQPAELTPKQHSSLHDVAAVVSALLEARLNERRARRQEARVRGASRASADWLWETDAAGAITWISAGVEAHTGESPASIVGRRAKDIYRSPPAEHRESFEAFQLARLSRQPFRDAIAERDTTRGPMIVSLSGEPVFNSDGEFMGYRGASRDITKLIALQRRAQRAELLLRGSIEHSHAAMLITAPDGEIIVSNAAWRSLVARYLSDPPSTWPALIEALVAAGAYPEAMGREEAFAQWRRTLDQRGAGMHGLRIGDSHHLVSAQRLADGSTVHLSIDITEHRQTQTALQEQQQRLAAVLRALPDLWFALDREGHYLDCSDETHPLHFSPFSDVRGKLVRDVLPPDAAQAMQSALSASGATRGVQRLEYELTVQGAPRQFEARLTPMGGDRVLLLVRDITELRSLERDVHLMQRAFEAPGSLPMTVVDATQPDLPLIYVNAAFEALSGRSRQDLLGRSCRFLQGSDRNQPGLTELRSALAQGRGIVVRLRNYRADGAQFINELHVAPVRDSNGRLTHFVGVQHDVTERSRAEQQLALREALYRSVTAAISDGLLVVDLRGAIVTANPAACRLLNLPQEALVGRQTRALGFQLLRDDGTPLPNESDPVTEVLRGGPNVVDRVLGMRRPDGTERVFNISAHRLLTGIEVSETACVVAFRDITEQRAAERGMAQAEARWRFALEEAGDGLIDYDEDTHRTFFSPRWKAMLGYTHQEIGQSLQEWSHRIHPEDYPRVMRTVKRYRAGELPEYRSEHRLRHKNGHWVWVLDRAKIVERRSDGSPRRVVAIYTDITRMKAADSALRDKRAAELASASKSEFLSRMSHEMRTPLNAVIGFAQLLQMRGDAGRPVPVAQYSEHIVQSGRHLLALVNDVLDLQQVEAGRMTLAPESVGLLQALQAAQRLVEPSALMKKITVSLDVDPQLTVWADPRRLQQVLLNLMSNGIKYNQTGGQLRCEVESIVTETHAASRAVLIISDTGEGLSADQMARLFQPFERLGRETTTVEGSGLGLVISRALVREMNGSLTMSSQVGTGSRVRVELPMAAPHAVAWQGEASAPTAAAIQPPPTLRMLYVEDNRLNALLFEEAIKMRGGVELRVVEDGPDAFELLKGWHPDVLVLDAHLPSMSGYEVLTRLRQQPQFARTPAFMCSADALPDELQRAREAGFAGYWSKPIDIAQVMKELDALPPPLPTAPAAIRS